MQFIRCGVLPFAHMRKDHILGVDVVDLLNRIRCLRRLSSEKKAKPPNTRADGRGAFRITRAGNAKSKEGNNVIVQHRGRWVNAPGENVDLDPTRPGHLVPIKALRTILAQNFSTTFSTTQMVLYAHKCSFHKLRQGMKKAPKVLQCNAFRAFQPGTPEGTRTPNIQNRNLTLYPIELRAHLEC